MSDINRADLQAIRDVAAALTEQSDSVTLEQAVILMREAKAAAATLRAAIDLLESRALSLIEQPVMVGNVVYSKKPEFKRRPDQTLIKRVVTEVAAAPDENGELPTAHDAATRAVATMAALYVSPSTVPKVGGVKALGLSMSDVCEEEHTGFTLSITELE